MEIAFATPRLQRRFESEKELRRAYGRDSAKKIMTRIADIEAATSLEEFRRLPGRCHELGGDRQGQLALDLAGGKRLVFEPNHNPAPVKEDGGLDWSLVEAVRVIEVVDYH
jgi:proteic killer suppression protein